MTWGKNFGFDMKVGLDLQVEALTPEVISAWEIDACES